MKTMSFVSILAAIAIAAFVSLNGFEAKPTLQNIHTIEVWRFVSATELKGGTDRSAHFVREYDGVSVQFTVDKEFTAEQNQLFEVTHVHPYPEFFGEYWWMKRGGVQIWLKSKS